MPRTVKPIPEGFNTITPHIVCKNASAAIDFYKKAFGAEEIVRMPGPDGKSVMHAELKIGNSRLMLGEEFSDKCTSPQTLGGSPVTIHLYVENADAAFQRAVKAGATVTMPLMDAFWGDRYGQLTDPFGHVWSIATHMHDYSPEEMEKKMKEAFAQMGVK